MIQYVRPVFECCESDVLCCILKVNLIIYAVIVMETRDSVSYRLLLIPLIQRLQPTIEISYCNIPTIIKCSCILILSKTLKDQVSQYPAPYPYVLQVGFQVFKSFKYIISHLT